MAIDQGTTGTTVAIVDQSGFIVDKVNNEYPQIYPQPGWVEHNPEDIWHSVTKTIGEVLKKSGINPKEIATIGITNQRETSLIWSRYTNQTIYNAIVWQCRRTTDFCNKLKKSGKGKIINKKTGLVLDPYFSATKFRWILDHVKGARKLAATGELACGTIDSFLLWRLTDGEVHATDVSNASRTMLMNIDSGEWDAELLKIFSVPKNMLPEIRPSSGEFGCTLNVPGLPDGIPISGIAGDQQAALFGQACFAAGDAKCTFGTGSFLLMNTGSKRVKSKSGILTTVAWQLKNDKKLTYALEGGAFICGAAVQWLRDGMKMISSSSGVESLAQEVSDSGGVEFVPALTGLGAPYWDAEARGMICGLTRGSTRAHLARATLDAMALQNLDILSAMQKDLGKKLKSLKVDGGATSNNLLMQLQADYLGQSISRPKMIESTVLGAAYLAGLGAGFWKNQSEIKKVWQLDQDFKPKISSKARIARVKSWHAAISRARS
ncbi:MAG: glycerol kinase GlpK [Bdellovibrionales bacterium]|nr:glycerol kinase GlpK [Bdellovibrionales bacterium]